MTSIGAVKGPEIDYLGLSPLFALLGGTVLVLMAGLVRGRFVQRMVVPALGMLALLVAIGLSVALWEPGDTRPIIESALAVDSLSLGISILCFISGLAAIVLSLRGEGMRETGSGEYISLLLSSITGMYVLASAENLITLFIGLELLSIPLYVLCGSHLRRAESLEAGLKYLVIGSLGSATLLYGLALIYGATGATDFAGIAAALEGEVSLGDSLLLTGIALSLVGLAFKTSVAPFHQWTPDVYQGAPTPITAFMAVATKAAAFAVFIRFLDQALILEQIEWGRVLAVLATVTIVIGNVGAITQSSLKRLMAWSAVAQAGYMLAGVVVGTQLGVRATAFYLAAYLFMNLGAFAVIVARERVSEHGDGIRSLQGLGDASPWLAWPMTICMLSLAGFPLTAGFIGKFYLIDAAVDGSYAWLGVAIVIGSMISLVYYLRVIAVMWMSPRDVEIPAAPGRRMRRLRPVGGWSPEADASAQPEVTGLAILMAAATLFFGIVPQPLFELARDVGSSLSGLG